MDRQARTGDTVLVVRREMTGRTQTPPWWRGGEEVKDDRKQNTLAQLTKIERMFPICLYGLLQPPSRGA
jgi:hypothetical protein